MKINTDYKNTVVKLTWIKYWVYPLYLTQIYPYIFSVFYPFKTTFYFVCKTVYYLYNERIHWTQKAVPALKLVRHVRFYIKGPRTCNSMGRFTLSFGLSTCIVSLQFRHLVSKFQNVTFWSFNEVVQNHMSEFLFDLDFDSKILIKYLNVFKSFHFKMWSSISKLFISFGWRLWALGLPLCSASFRKSTFHMFT